MATGIFAGCKGELEWHSSYFSHFFRFPRTTSHIARCRKFVTIHATVRCKYVEVESASSALDRLSISFIFMLRVRVHPCCRMTGITLQVCISFLLWPTIKQTQLSWVVDYMLYMYMLIDGKARWDCSNERISSTLPLWVNAEEPLLICLSLILNFCTNLPLAVDFLIQQSCSDKFNDKSFILKYEIVWILIRLSQASMVLQLSSFRSSRVQQPYACIVVKFSAAGSLCWFISAGPIDFY